MRLAGRIFALGTIKNAVMLCEIIGLMKAETIVSFIAKKKAFDILKESVRV